MLLLVACTEPPADLASSDGERSFEVEVETDAASPAIGGGIDVGWSSESGGPAEEGDLWYVEFGYDLSYGMIAPALEDGQATLLGLKADHVVHARVLRVRGDEVTVGPDYTFQTLPLPEGMPAMTGMVSWEDDQRFALLSMVAASAGSGFVLAVDGDGDVVWWDLFQGPFTSTARVLPDGGGVVYRTDDSAQYREGAVTTVRFDGSLRSEFEDNYGHHDVVALPDGSVAVLVSDVRPFGDYELVGDALVEIDPEGNRRQVWSSWDSITPVYDTMWDAGISSLGSDWTHANGVDYDPVSDTYAVSLYGTRSVVGIKRSSGEHVWTLGGTVSDFELQNDRYGFGRQHAPAFSETGIWLFDNHNTTGDPDAKSRLVHYALDYQAKQATLTWSYRDPTTNLHTDVLGDVRPLDDGYIASTWGVTGSFEMVSPEGELVWRVDAEDAMMLGRGDVFRSFYGPVSIPGRSAR